METLLIVLVALIALQHLGFLALEMFLWTHPWGRRVFGTKPDFAQASKGLAANQGLYNGFLVAGLVWALLAQESEMAQSLRHFFLTCVLIAGIFGAFTVSRRIFWIQGLPALIALGLSAFI